MKAKWVPELTDIDLMQSTSIKMIQSIEQILRGLCKSNIESVIVLLLISMKFHKVSWLISTSISILPSFLILNNSEWLEDLRSEPFYKKIQFYILIILSILFTFYCMYELTS